jgi:transcriptional regulator with XRE-family HTH domain
MRLRNAYGHIVRIIRQQNDLTLREVAKQAGISPAHLSEFERGKNEISSELFECLCVALKTEQSAIVLEAYRLLARQEAQERKRIENKLHTDRTIRAVI